MTALDFAQALGHTECAEFLIAVIEPRSQSVFNFTIVYPAVQIIYSCATQAALQGKGNGQIHLQLLPLPAGLTRSLSPSVCTGSFCNRFSLAASPSPLALSLILYSFSTDQYTAETCRHC